ncbi:hypothetical protein HNQ81_001823 [Desulfoprunum benzoelyticum]|uniref:Uncharacterized protein n=1 Tax=Desulfoprunum benzoelyticum TaxID=1506996 RepID=A0A840UQM4_9BACT|nr:hypothetical protein [Desulfoprunum benzoelyticum]
MPLQLPSSRPTPWFMPLQLPSSRPTPAVISTNPRCHLDRRERSSFARERQDFSLRFEMTAGAGSWTLPYREHRALSPRPTPWFMPFSFRHRDQPPDSCPFSFRHRDQSPGSCPFSFRHLDQPPLSSRPQGEIFFCHGTTRFLAALRNDSGGGGVAFALSGMTRFLAALRNDRGKKTK